MIDSTDYIRFIVLAGARTGSTMLVQALNSSSHIRCFGEVFNADVDFIPFGVDGYDNFSVRERALRDQDVGAFLQQRIFCRAPEGTRAVGFKLLYGQGRQFPGLLQRLIDDSEIRVLHLRRRNLLRSLVSWKIAETTGVWVQDQGFALANALTPANALRAARHPFRAATSLWRRWRLAVAPRETRRAKVTLTKDECATLFEYIQAHEANSETFFDAHPKLTLFYEDLLDRHDDVFNQVQSFLGVQPAPLAATSRRQNPEVLRDLLANYDELYDAFRGTRYTAFFD